MGDTPRKDINGQPAAVAHRNSHPTSPRPSSPPPQVPGLLPGRAVQAQEARDECEENKVGGSSNKSGGSNIRAGDSAIRSNELCETYTTSETPRLSVFGPSHYGVFGAYPMPSSEEARREARGVLAAVRTSISQVTDEDESIDDLLNRKFVPCSANALELMLMEHHILDQPIGKEEAAEFDYASVSLASEAGKRLQLQQNSQDSMDLACILIRAFDDDDNSENKILEDLETHISFILEQLPRPLAYYRATKSLLPLDTTGVPIETMFKYCQCRTFATLRPNNIDDRSGLLFLTPSGMKWDEPYNPQIFRGRLVFNISNGWKDIIVARELARWYSTKRWPKRSKVETPIHEFKDQPLQYTRLLLNDSLDMPTEMNSRQPHTPEVEAQFVKNQWKALKSILEQSLLTYPRNCLFFVGQYFANRLTTTEYLEHMPKALTDSCLTAATKAIIATRILVMVYMRCTLPYGYLHIRHWSFLTTNKPLLGNIQNRNVGYSYIFQGSRLDITPGVKARGCRWCHRFLCECCFPGRPYMRELAMKH